MRGAIRGILEHVDSTALSEVNAGAFREGLCKVDPLVLARGEW